MSENIIRHLIFIHNRHVFVIFPPPPPNVRIVNSVKIIASPYLFRLVLSAAHLPLLDSSVCGVALLTALCTCIGLYHWFLFTSACSTAAAAAASLLLLLLLLLLVMLLLLNIFILLIF
jgi:hypothetical protein